MDIQYLCEKKLSNEWRPNVMQDPHRGFLLHNRSTLIVLSEVTFCILAFIDDLVYYVFTWLFLSERIQYSTCCILWCLLPCKMIIEVVYWKFCLLNLNTPIVTFCIRLSCLRTWHWISMMQNLIFNPPTTFLVQILFPLLKIYLKIWTRASRWLEPYPSEEICVSIFSSWKSKFTTLFAN